MTSMSILRREMIPPYGEQITIARIDHDTQFGVTQLQSRSEGDGPTVGRVEGVQIHVSGDATRTADPRDDGRSLKIDLGLRQSSDEAVDRRADPTTRTPDMRHPILPQQVYARNGRCRRMRCAGPGRLAHFTASRMES
jgi:hypothetical protein